MAVAWQKANTIHPTGSSFKQTVSTQFKAILKWGQGSSPHVLVVSWLTLRMLWWFSSVLPQYHRNWPFYFQSWWKQNMRERQFFFSSEIELVFICILMWDFHCLELWGRLEKNMKYQVCDKTWNSNTYISGITTIHKLSFCSIFCYSECNFERNKMNLKVGIYCD